EEMVVAVGEADVEVSVEESLGVSVEVSVGVSVVVEAGVVTIEDSVSVVDATFEDDAMEAILEVAELLAMGVEEDMGAGPFIDELKEAAVMGVVDTGLDDKLTDGVVAGAGVRLAVVCMVKEAEPALNEVNIASKDDDCACVEDAEDVPVLAALILETTDDPDDPLP
ncbi:hypothetical protein LTR33_013022, partial [Friedmanniomyces endolithicus]